MRKYPLDLSLHQTEVAAIFQSSGSMNVVISSFVYVDGWGVVGLNVEAPLGRKTKMTHHLHCRVSTPPIYM